MAIARSAEETALIERARRVLPAGSFGNFAADIVIREGRGGRVWDVSGNEYVDYLLGSGPMFIGHCHPEVVEAVREQVGRGTTFFANNEHGIALAEAIVEAVPCAEQVRFLSSGTEADLYAMRLARAFRGRDRILKFEGGYHGMSDYGLMSLAPRQPGNFPLPVPDSAGIPRSVRDEVLVAPFNDAEAVERLVAARHEEIAAIIVEPFQRLIPPAPGFLAALRALCDRHGILLIFDEVVTGFRFAYGGAQAYYGVTPDLCTLGKIIGGGFPLAAVAGRAGIMAHFDKAQVGEDRFLLQIGTLSGNPVASVAGLKTLEILRRPGAYEKVFATGRALMEGIADQLRRAGLPAQVVGEPPLFDVVFADGEVRDYRGTLRADREVQAHVNAHLRQGGILKGESKFYLSLAHEERDVAQTLEAFAAAIAALPARRAGAA
ncbi:aspartate aminotransferase family protein [Crenalkalicoccus roseus]|uniref:aspartate aminotransferase family protein n=1 Tax=Crenalkalicoccus roseus TaxID=1485588 RepID=UPI0010822866|nr:aminotransferase class III-fold pyridoxal phosphate-dependent enzyme [Crenalkalicoccus roseus]